METFREFIESYESEEHYHFNDLEVANLYFHHSNMSVRELSRKTGKSIGEVYRIIKNFGSPNRTRPHGRENVINLADSGLAHKHIANMTGYSARQVRNILKERT